MLSLLNVIGLSLTLLGAIFLACNYLISNKKAAELGVSRVAGETLEENLKLPAVQDRLKQRRYAIIGLSMVILGFVIQILALITEC
jgi:hypothetical protein